MAGIIISEEQWLAVDSLVNAALREAPVFEAFPSKMTRKGDHEYRYAEALKWKAVEIGDKFGYDERNRPARNFATSKITQITVPVLVEGEEFANSDPLSLITEVEIEGNDFLNELIEEVVFHGATGNASKGLCNYAGVGSFGTDGNKTLSTLGNTFIQLEGAMNIVRAQHIKGPYTLFITPGIITEMRGNWVSGIKNEYEQFKETYLDKGIIDKVIETDSIATSSAGLSVALSTSTQGMVVAKMGVQNGFVVQSYTKHRDAIPNKPFESDLSYALRWGGGYVPKRAESVCIVTGLATTTAY
jgi:hypothetical protein